MKAAKRLLQSTKTCYTLREKRKPGLLRPLLQSFIAIRKGWYITASGFPQSGLVRVKQNSFPTHRKKQPAERKLNPKRKALAGKVTPSRSCMKRTSLPSRDGQPAQDLVPRKSPRARVPSGGPAAFTCLLRVWNKSDAVNPLSLVVGAGEEHLVKKGLARTSLRINPPTDTNKRHKKQ